MCTGNRSEEAVASRCKGSCAGPGPQKVPDAAPEEQFQKCHGVMEQPGDGIADAPGPAAAPEN